ncbi:NADH-quinone oxidoreductase subunit NuoH [Planctomicrobium piriforme]|uniref:NADH-quinone oxidoreductase subunit H n=1 Tax=Planctomicrobium piriforme TaxID=1576369 RepID=A0A1I3G1U0_9PLAN|nr:NADH-quinone oxidoreductase subunit NuoH [Planctomicrobium piriforme]SFI17455.1 NADH-quinone oxidoreductase subunit H [Planctomicrobium piriforme]
MKSVLLSTTMTEWLAETAPWLPDWIPMFVAAAIHTALIGLFFGLPAFAFIWAERKVSGRLQDRLGPTRTGGRFGWLQSLADGIKLVQKEDLAPHAADRMLFQLAPYIVVVASFAAFMFVPFSDGWVSVGSDVGLFIALAVLSLEVLGIVLAGYSSGSKWSLFGGMREAAQMVSYEVPLGITAVIPVLIAGSMNLNEIVSIQSGGFWNWLIFHDPFSFLAFFVFFTVTLASNKRAPFDLAEAESELVGGFHTEYSGMRWSFFFLAEYASMFFVSMLGAILFLGGWWTGLPFIDNSLVAVNDSSFAYGYLTRVLGMVVLLVKAGILVNVQIWIRWTLPRLRIDQVMTTCLKYLVPISCFLFLGATLWPLLLAATLQRSNLFSPIGERVPRPRVVAPRNLEIETARLSDPTQGVR